MAGHIRGSYTPRSMPDSDAFPAGKLPPDVLRALLRKVRPSRASRVVIGPRYGEDAAVIDLGSKYLVAKTDPITFTEDRLGWYAVNINANDIATLGATPRWFLATVLLPERRATKQMARQIFLDILHTCRTLGITLCGGHTEITVGLQRPIVIGQMLGEVKKSQLIRKASQRPGDMIILTRGIAIEGTAILARERPVELQKTVGRASVQRAKRWLFEPGISIVQDARVAVHHGEIHAMHDPTEGGLLSGLAEIAEAGGVGIRVWGEKIPVLPETQAFSRALGFDPLALISSGALLVVATRDSTDALIRAYARRGVPAAVIGEVRPLREGNRLLAKGKEAPLRIPKRDEIARLLE